MRYKECFILSKSDLKIILQGRSKEVLQIGQYYRLKGCSILHRFAGVDPTGVNSTNYNIGKGAAKAFFELCKRLKGKRQEQLSLF